jgi:hypothetical protein
VAVTKLLFRGRSVTREEEFLNIFAKKCCGNLPFFTKNNAKLCKHLIITLVFEENADFVAENCKQMSIITSTADFWTSFD